MRFKAAVGSVRSCAGGCTGLRVPLFWLQRDQTTPDSEAYCLRPIRCPELAANRRDVEFHGLIADSKTRRDRLVGKSFGEQLEDLDFARGQRLVVLVTTGCLVDTCWARRKGAPWGGGDEYRIGLDTRRARLCQCVEFAGDGKRTVLKFGANSSTAIRCPDQQQPHRPLGRAAFADGDGYFRRLAAAKQAQGCGLADTVSNQPVEQLLG